jgi:hypothetical protein
MDTKALLIFLALVVAVVACVRLFTRGRKKAIATLKGYVEKLMDPQGCLEAFHYYDRGLDLCSTYELNGTEFGLGGLEAFYRMTWEALVNARSHVDPDDVGKLAKIDIDLESTFERRLRWNKWRSQRLAEVTEMEPATSV